MTARETSASRITTESAPLDLCRAALWPELTEAVPFDEPAHERQARSVAP